MAEQRTELTPQRDRGVARPSSWSGHPFGVLQRLADDMDRFFDDFGFGRSALGSPYGRTTFGESSWVPRVDVQQKGDQLTIHADLPGLSKDDVSVEVTDSAVTIHGERKREHHDEHQGFYRSERSYGSFARVIPLPEGAITDQAKANFRDGVLEITIPAPPASRGRRLPIGSETRTEANAPAQKK